MSKFTIRIAKEYQKFSASHFTVFHDGTVENLHGHNYYVSLELDCLEAKDGLVIDFRELKKIVKDICDTLDEKILIAGESQTIRVNQSDRITVTFRSGPGVKEFVFPANDVVMMPLNNISSEMLAKYLADEVATRLKGREAGKFVAIRVGVEETRGQSVIYEKLF